MAANPLHDPLDALKFLVAFAQVDLREASARALQTIERNVQRFIHRDSPGHWRFDESPDVVLLGELQRRAFGMLRDLKDEETPRTLAIVGDLILSFYIVRAGGERRMEVMGHPLSLFLYQMARVLDAVGLDRVFACPACGRLFVKVTKKAFCSTKCQSRIYMRKYRAGELGGE